MVRWARAALQAAGIGMLMSMAGCVVAGPDRAVIREERWCYNHPAACDHEKWCANHPGVCAR